VASGSRGLIGGLIVLSLLLLAAGGASAEPEPPPRFPNNPVGINLARWIEHPYLWAAAELVNSNGGDWGHVTIVLVEDDRADPDRLQRLFDQCYLHHLVPIVRIGTRFDLARGVWARPQPNDPYLWREFFDRVRWPTTHHYIVVGNEPNLGREWGGAVDAADYARYLEKWLTVFADDRHYRVFNGALDASNDTSLPERMDEYEFIAAMRQASPTLFERLDGWASNPYHFRWWAEELRYSYRAYEAELAAIGRDMPVIIVESATGHVDDPRAVADYYEMAFKHWLADPRVVAATPLFWNPEAEQFWMYDVDGDGSVREPSPTYFRIKELRKSAGSPHFLSSVENVARPPGKPDRVQAAFGAEPSPAGRKPEDSPAPVP
jgi:hypothetical protein